MKYIKLFLIIIAITIVCFLAVDFVLSQCGITPEHLKKTSVKANKNAYHTIVVSHNIYHHGLNKNLDTVVRWGNVNYRLCTNKFGFKVSCTDKETEKDKEAEKKFDIAFIGDSFTESVGTSYEGSFVGMYAQKHPEYSVVNLGVGSYSPSIYLTKIKYLLDNDFVFKHIVVLPDISDIQDESNSYIIDNGIVVNKGKDVVNKSDYIDYIKKNLIIKHDENNKNIAVKFIFNILNNKHIQYVRSKIRKYFTFTFYCMMRFNDTFYPYNSSWNRSYWTVDQDIQGYNNEGVKGGVAQAMEAMHKLKQLCDRHGIKMSVAVYPWPAQLMFNERGHPGVQIWRDFCAAENCANFIDANTFFYNEIEHSYLTAVLKKYYIDEGDFHFNESGNKAIFEVINKSFKP
jgi:lysophospholipase L1-like esterase